MNVTSADIITRLLAHDIIYDGRHYGFSVAEIAPDGTLTITPFSGQETHSTTFISGVVTVKVAPDSRRLLVETEIKG